MSLPIPIAVQLYSLRDAAADDLPGVLEQVARAGFLGVEYASLHDQAPADVRRWSSDLGLEGVGIHRRLPPGAEGAPGAPGVRRPTTSGCARRVTK